MSKIIRRIERELGLPDLATTLAQRLKPSDLQSLWLEITKRQVIGRTPARVLADYASNRFVRPSPVQPRAVEAWENVLYEQLPSGIARLELSPVCPLGTNSVVAKVAQNWAVATERNTEVVSDCTNVLALEAALRRKAARGGENEKLPVHLAASHRLLRAQAYQRKGQVPHFRLFGLCSAGRGADFETNTLAMHVGVFVDALYRFLGPETPVRFAVSDFGDPRTPADLLRTWLETLQQRFPKLVCQVAPERATGRGYYRGWCFHLFATSPAGEELFVADGGAVRWSRDLLSDEKERMVISGIGSERVCTGFLSSPEDHQEVKDTDRAKDA